MSEEPKDPPIEALEFLGGVKVVDIGDIRVARGLSRRPVRNCPHSSIIYDTHERRIWCEDCERNIDPFDAFVLLVERHDDAAAALRRREAVVEAAEQHSLISIAAKVIDKAWRKQRTVPCCPVCGVGIFPEDFKNGTRIGIGREIGIAQRAKLGHPVPGMRS